MEKTESPALAARDGSAHRAIIDIGSNTVRLVVYGPPDRAPVVVFNEKVTARLGKGVAEDGALAPKASALALEALGRFATLLRLRGVRDVECVATAAVRDATNGQDFLAAVERLGLGPRLLSGEEEAVASAHGVLSAFPGAHGVVADLGGGSLELIDIANNACTHGVSLPLGTLRLPALRADGPDKFARRLAKMLAGAQWSAHPGQTLYLVGGSLRALARFAMVLDDWPIDDPHGFELTAEQAARMVRALAARMRPGAVPGMPAISGLSSGRIASLPDAGALLGALVSALQPARIVFSGWGLREGLLATRLDPQVAAQNPLIVGVSAFVETQRAGLASAASRMALWMAPIAEAAAGLAGGGASSAATGRHLLRAATMLALASLGTEPNLRVEQATQWALRKRWIGLDAAGRAMIAAAVLANSGKVVLPDTLVRLAPAGALNEAQAWGLAMRLARRMTGGIGSALDAAALSVVGGELVLSLKLSHASLFTEATAKDLRVLAERLGLAPRYASVPNDTQFVA